LTEKGWGGVQKKKLAFKPLTPTDREAPGREQKERVKQLFPKQERQKNRKKTGSWAKKRRT